MKDYNIHNFGEGEILEYEDSYIPKSFWVLVAGLLIWGVYYTVTYFNFIPEFLR